jgi:hypothetical protein
VNLEPVRLEAANLAKLPPLFDTYTHPPPSIPLVAKGTTGPILATVEGESSHAPTQRPTFSIAGGGSLDPEAGYGLPKPPQITLSRAGLGLQAGDDLDALSFGADAIDAAPHTTLAFSVDPMSEGSPGTGVAQEAATGEQESAEYVSFVNSTNQLLVPGDLIVPITGDAPPGDDLDALTDQEASRVDMDDDGTPEDPVFLSLATGSPTLTGLSASPADVLVAQGGALSVFATAADIGLVSGDDLDAMCLMKSGLPNSMLRPGSGPPAAPLPGIQIFDYMLFSLAIGSPTLAAQGHTAADIFVTDFSNNRPNLSAQPLALYAEASELGLLDMDELNALKCLPPVVMFEITGDGDLDGPGNKTGCEDIQLDAGFYADIGLSNHDGDHLVMPSSEFGQPNFFAVWSVQNPLVGDAHGPYAYPGTLASAFMPFGDPAVDVFFVGGPGDNCGLPHIHGGFFGVPNYDRFGFHEDLDVLACGHGVFVPGAFPIFEIPTRRSEVPAVTQSLVNFLNRISGGLFQASWHKYNGPPTLDISDCTSPETKRTMLLVSGIGITTFNAFLYSGYLGDDLGPPPPGPPQAIRGVAAPDPSVSPPLPIRIGPPLRSVPPLLVPEPDAPWLAGTACLTLAYLARRRRQRAATATAKTRYSAPEESPLA